MAFGVVKEQLALKAERDWEGDLIKLVRKQVENHAMVMLGAEKSPDPQSRGNQPAQTVFSSSPLLRLTYLQVLDVSTGP